MTTAAHGPYWALKSNATGTLKNREGDLCVMARVGPHFQENARRNGQTPVRIMIVELPETVPLIEDSTAPEPGGERG